MIYNLNNKIDSIKANERLQWLMKNEKRIEPKAADSEWRTGIRFGKFIWHLRDDPKDE